MAQRSLSDHQEQEVARRYEAGETTRELAEAFGCSTRPIFGALRKHGTKMRKGGAQPGAPSHNRRFTPAQDQEVAAEYAAGAAIRTIAEAHGVSPAAVHGALKRAGMERRDGSPNRLFTPEQDEQIAREYVAGKGLEALASERGCSHDPIREALKRQGIDSRRGGGQKREWSSAEIAEMTERYLLGESQETLAGAFHTSQAAVSRLLRANGVKTRMWAKGPEAHGSWKGGRVEVTGGYVGVWIAPDDPLASLRNVHGYALEHRLVMARSLNRPLDSHETVHHKNGDRSDNRIENLQLRNGRHGKGFSYTCRNCGSHNVEAREPK